MPIFIKTISSIILENVPFTACCFQKRSIHSMLFSERNQNRNLHVLDIGQKLKVESYKGYYLLKSILF